MEGCVDHHVCFLFCSSYTILTLHLRACAESVGLAVRQISDHFHWPSRLTTHVKTGIHHGIYIHRQNLCWRQRTIAVASSRSLPYCVRSSGPHLSTYLTTIMDQGATKLNPQAVRSCLVLSSCIAIRHDRAQNLFVTTEHHHHRRWSLRPRRRHLMRPRWPQSSRIGGC